MKNTVLDIFLCLLGFILICAAVVYAIAEPFLWLQFLFTNS